MSRFALVLLVSLFPAAVCLRSQTAVFPGAVATDQQMKVATDNAQTVLTAALNTTATSFTVVTAAKFVANELVTIDNEQISICSIVGSTMNVGHSSCPNVDGRGFNHTAAAGHNTGAIVSAFITAWNFNSTTAEIKSIENSLGPNLSAVASKVASTLNPNLYNFAAVSPSTPLIAGNTTVTFPQVPVGMNGSDFMHNVYVSGGTGPSEACAIAGGTGTSGQVNGQIILNCPHAHSGGYAVTSASAGFAEAWMVGPFLAPTAGAYNFYAPVTPPVSGSVHCGGAYTYGSSGVQLQYNSPTGAMFNVVFDGFSLTDGCQLVQIGTPTSSYGIYTCGNGCASSPHQANNWTLENVEVSSFWKGIYIDGGSGNAYSHNIIVDRSLSDNITIGGSQGHLIDIISEFAGGHGINYVNNSSNSGGGGVWLSGIQTYANTGYGIYAAIGGLWVGGNLSYLNLDNQGGIYVNGFGGQLSNITIQYEGLTYAGAPWPTNKDAVGLSVGPSGQLLNISDILFYANQGKCMLIAGSNNQFTNINATNCGVGGDTVFFNNFAVHFTSGGQLNTVTTSQFGATIIAGHPNLTLVANQFVQNSTILPALEISGPTTLNLVGNYIYQGAAGGWAVQCGSSAVLAEAGNLISGGISGTCQRSANSRPLTPGFLYQNQVAGLAALPGSQSGFEVYVTDGTPGSTPCTAGGAGALAMYTGTQWNCH